MPVFNFCSSGQNFVRVCSLERSLKRGGNRERGEAKKDGRNVEFLFPLLKSGMFVCSLASQVKSLGKDGLSWQWHTQMMVMQQSVEECILRQHVGKFGRCF